MDDNDEHLIKRLSASDVEAFRVLFEQYQPVLFRYIVHGLRDTEGSHDIVQETFLRVWNNRASLQPHRSLLAYLLRIGGNLLRDQVKHRNVRARHEEDVPITGHSHGDDPESASHASLLRQIIANLVNTKLPDKCRMVFLLSRMEGMSNAEISGKLGLSIKTVENQITRAQKILRRHLRDYR